MRKFFLTLSLLIPLWLSSQVHLTQNFTGTFPPQGWSAENYTTQWSQSNTSFANGTAPELKFTYTSGTLTTRFISPNINLTGVSNLRLSFKHFVAHYGSGYTVGVATRSNNGTWNSVWSVSPSGDISESRTITISNSDVGSANFQFCFYLSGNAYQIDYWYIDDVSLYTPYNTDISLKSIDVNKYIVAGNTDVKVAINNVGLTNINSFTANYKINEGATISENVTGINLTPNNSYVYTFSQKWLATPGNYNLNAWITNVNGSSDDDDVSNNSLTKPIMVASNSVPNMPFFESFTSSTCPPCYTFNTNTFTPFLNSNYGQYAIIKYQMNWPGSGDPYYTAEGGTRRVYYGVSVVPTLFTGGKVTATSATGLNNAFNSEKVKPAFFTINASTYIHGTTVTANIGVIPYVTSGNLILHAAVVERETFGNALSNGETSFKYVMMKMLPNASGTTVNFTDGVPYNLTLTQNLAGLKVEQYNDLMLVVFIQNDENKEIMQSKMVYIPLAYTLTFNVKNGTTPIDGAMVAINGQNITTNTSGVATIGLPNGTYNYTVSKNDFGAYNGSVVVSNANVSVNVQLQATSIEASTQSFASLFPNPNTGTFSIQLPEIIGNVKVEVYSATGSLVENAQYEAGNGKIDMNISQPKGVYFLKLTLENGLTQTLKLVVK